jgi:hypothetical protein
VTNTFDMDNALTPTLRTNDIACREAAKLIAERAAVAAASAERFRNAAWRQLQGKALFSF